LTLAYSELILALDYITNADARKIVTDYLTKRKQEDVAAKVNKDPAGSPNGNNKKRSRDEDDVCNFII